MARMSGAEVIIECLKSEGVKYIFGIAGGATIPLLDVISKTPEIQYISTRHEQVATHMADGYARYSGKLGVVFTTRAAGASNTVLGVATAYSSDSPIMVIAMDPPIEFLGKGDYQEFDLVTLFSPITKFSYRIESVSKIPYIMQKAIRLAYYGRPGPVFLSIPDNLIREEADVEVPPRERYIIDAKPAPPIELIEEAAGMLVKAENPAILAGSEVVVSDASEELKRLAEELAIPVVPCFGQTDVIPSNSIFFFRDWERFPEIDLLLAVGTDVADVRTWPKIGGETRIIQIEVDAEQIGKVYPADVSIVADVKKSLNALNNKVTEIMSDRDRERVRERREKIAKIKEEFLSEKWPKEEWDVKPIRPWRLIRDLREVLDEDAIIAHDSGSFSTSWIRRCMDFYKPKTCFCCLAGIMGFGLPGALGLKLAAPEKDVVAVVGDGAFMMVASALSTSVQYKIPITVVINDNSAYMQIKWRQKPPYLGSDLVNPDFVKFAESFGIPARRVTEPEELKDALKWAIEETRKGRTALLDVVTTNDPKYANPQMYFKHGR